MLDARRVASWLDPRTAAAAEATHLLRPAPEAMMRTRPVSTAVNDGPPRGA